MMVFFGTNVPINTITERLFQNKVEEKPKIFEKLLTLG